MELVYKNGLVQFSGAEETDRNGEKRMVFHFRNGAGESFDIELPQNDVPNKAFACHDEGFFTALQEILDNQARYCVN